MTAGVSSSCQTCWEKLYYFTGVVHQVYLLQFSFHRFQQLSKVLFHLKLFPKILSASLSLIHGLHVLPKLVLTASVDSWLQWISYVVMYVDIPGSFIIIKTENDLWNIANEFAFWKIPQDNAEEKVLIFAYFSNSRRKLMLNYSTTSWNVIHTNH